jgi:hypothetical protein
MQMIRARIVSTSLSGLWPGSDYGPLATVAWGQHRSEPQGFWRRYSGELSERGEVASVRDLASDYLPGICARNLDGANNIFRL